MRRSQRQSSTASETRATPHQRTAAQLTAQQRKLVDVIEYRRRHGIPTVQRDLAEALGIRRDSVNKLLARTRRRLGAAGRDLAMPPRHASGRVGLSALAADA